MRRNPRLLVLALVGAALVAAAAYHGRTIGEAYVALESRWQPSRSHGPTPLRLRGRCVDPRGQPLAGCTVSVSRRGTPEMPPRVVATTDRDGEFSFPEPDAGAGSVGDARASLWVEFRGEGRAVVQEFWQLRSRFEDRGDVVLPRGFEFHGRLVDADGNGIGGVELTAVRRTARTWQGRVDRATTSAEGVFRFDPIPPDWLFLTSSEPRLANLGLRPGVHRCGTNDAPLVVRAEPTRAVASIAGRVVDASGQAVTGAEVWAGRLGHSSSGVTDAEGRFSLPRFEAEPDVPAQLTVVAEGYVTCVRRSVTWETRDVVLTLHRRAAGRVRVVHAETRAPIEGVAVEFLFEDGFGTGYSAETGVDGIALLEDVVPDRYRVHAHATGSGLRQGLPQTVVVEEGTRTLEVDVELHPVRPRTFRLLWLDGEPIDRARIDLRLPLPQPSWTTEPAYVDVDSACVTPGMEGVFEFGAAPGCDHTLAVRTEGAREVIVEEVAFPGTGPLEVRVPRPGRILGQIGPVAVLEALRRARIQAGLGPTLEITRVRADSETDVRRALVAADGTFSLLLEPGNHDLFLEIALGSRRGARVRVAHVAALGAGEERHLDLRVDDLAPGSLRGRIVVNGRPHEGTCTLRFERQPPTGEIERHDLLLETAEDGGFLATTVASTCRVDALVGEAGGTLSWLESSPGIEVVAGRAQQAEFAVDTVLVEVVTLAQDDRPCEVSRLQAAPTLCSNRVGRGRYQFLLSPGRHELRALPPRLHDYAAFAAHVEEHPDSAGDEVAGVLEVPVGTRAFTATLRVPDTLGY